MTSADVYIHGTDPDEQRRLALLNDLLNEGSLRALALRPGERVLDVGCGTGQLTRAMARAVGPDGLVVGVERSPEQLAGARREGPPDDGGGRLDLREGDAIRLPLEDDEWGRFDVAHARFLLEHVRDPPAVVRVMVRAVRPGGRVLLEDDDHDVMRFWPEPPRVRRLWDAYVRTFEKLGCDPYVGRRLVALLHEAGASPRRNHWSFFGCCAGHPDFAGFVANFVGILAGARDRIVEAGLLDRSAVDGGIEDLKEWGRRPDASLWYAVSWAEGVRPEAAPNTGR